MYAVEGQCVQHCVAAANLWWGGWRGVRDDGGLRIMFVSRWTMAGMCCRTRRDKKPPHKREEGRVVVAPAQASVGVLEKIPNIRTACRKFVQCFRPTPVNA